MHALIDGNNLQYAAAEAGPWDEPGRVRLCHILGEWGKKQNKLVVVVFDGAPPPPGVTALMRQGSIEVRFSGPGRCADDLLVEAIRVHSAPRRLVVVSSDRLIRAAAKRRGCRAVGSAAFVRELVRGLRRPAPGPAEPPEKRSGPSPEDSELWLRLFDADES